MKKNYIIIALGALAAVAYLFLPFVSFMGRSMSFVEFLNVGIKAGILDYLPIVAGILLVIAGFTAQRKLAIGFSIAGTVVMIAQLGQLGESLGVANINAAEVVGFGFWIALAALAVSIFFSFKMDK